MILRTSPFCPVDVSPSIAADQGFRLLGWTVEPDACQLHRDGETVRLEPKVMGVLSYLARRQGQVVSRDELLEAVWPDVVVTDSAVNRCISELRRVFGDDPRDARVIETIPKRGYRLLPPVEAAPAKRSEPVSEPVGASGVGSRSAWARRRGGLLAMQVGLVVAVVLVLLVVGSLGSSHLASPSPLESRPLTSLPGVERDAAISPDGSHVAFVWRSPEATSFDLYVQDLTTSEPLALTATPTHERFPTWSPDGRWIAFARFESGACGIFVTSVLGTAERRLADCTRASGLSWSPDGAWLALGEYDPAIETSRIVLLSPETLERRPLTYPTAGTRGDFAPVFAPGGQSVAFARGGERYGAARLFEAQLDAEGAEPLTPALDDVAGMAWDGATGQVVVAAEYRGIGALWRVVNPTTLERVPYGADRMPRNPVATAEGLVVEHWTYALDLVSVGPTPFPMASLASTRADEQPALAPDGDRVAFISDRAGAPELWVAGSDGSLSRPLSQSSFPQTARVRAPAWSPDGQWLVAEVHTANDIDIIAIPSSGGAPRLLTDHAAADLAPSVSHDGAWVYFGSMRSGAWQVWKVPIAGGRAIRVTEEGGYRALESTDGRQLFVAKYGEAGLWAHPLDGQGQPHRAMPLHAVDWGNWAVTDRGLLAVDRTGPTPRVVAWEDGAESPTPLGPAVAVVRGDAGLAASRDGQVVVVTHANGFESDLLLLETPAP